MAFGLQPYAAGPYAQLTALDLAALISAFNFCDPFDHILPPPDSTISIIDMQHLWGLYSGIAATASNAAILLIIRPSFEGRMNLAKGGMV